MVIGSGHSIDWCKKQPLKKLIAIYKCLKMAQAEREMSFFRAASYAQVVDAKVRSSYEETLIKQRNGE